MARPRKHPDGLKKTVSFKLSEADFKIYEDKVFPLGWKIRTFLERWF